MSTYIYEAYNKHNEILEGEYEAVSKEEVIAHLIKHNLTAISIKPIRVHSRSKGILSIELFSTLSPVDIMFLVRNLNTMVKAGLSIVESLDILIKDTEKTVMKKVLEEAQAMIKNGKSLSSGFENHRDLFPPIFIGMIKAGEVSGQLDKTLSELAKYLSKEYTLRSKVKAALTYPIILLVASTLVVALMLIFVLPKLTKSFAQSGVELPWFTKVFLFISQLLTFSFVLDIIFIAVVVWFFLYFRTTRLGKRFFFFVISHTPVASELVKKVALVRFTRTFGNLIGSGLSVIDAILISSQSMDNQNYANVLEKTVEDIKNGISVSESIGRYPSLFPRLLVSLIVVGERTGTLEGILATFSDFYEEEVDNTLKELTSFLEPVLLLIMGLMIGGIAISIILPIYQLVGHFV